MFLQLWFAIVAIPTRSINSFICPPVSTPVKQRIVVYITIDFLSDKTTDILHCATVVFYSESYSFCLPVSLVFLEQYTAKALQRNNIVWPLFWKTKASNSDTAKFAKGTRSVLRKRLGVEKIARKWQSAIRNYHLIFISFGRISVWNALINSLSVISQCYLKIKLVYFQWTR